MEVVIDQDVPDRFRRGDGEVEQKQTKGAKEENPLLPSVLFIDWTRRHGNTPDGSRAWETHGTQRVNKT